MQRRGRTIRVGGQRPHRGRIKCPRHPTPLKRRSQECVDEHILATCDGQCGFRQLDPSLLGYGTNLDANSIRYNFHVPIGRAHLCIARGKGGDDTVRIHGRHGLVRGLPGDRCGIRMRILKIDRLDPDSLTWDQYRPMGP